MPVPQLVKLALPTCVQNRGEHLKQVKVVGSFTFCNVRPAHVSLLNHLTLGKAHLPPAPAIGGDPRGTHPSPSREWHHSILQLPVRVCGADKLRHFACSRVGSAGLAHLRSSQSSGASQRLTAT
jgi:hypothetical protein